MTQLALQGVPLLTAAATRNPDDIPVLIVMLIGVSLVFAILFLLIFIIFIQGKIFGFIEKKKQGKKIEAAPSAPVQPVQAAPAAASAAAPVIEEGIPAEVVAAIVAAVDAATGGSYTLRAVTTAKKGRGAWGLAGVVQSTEPF